jgi:site-specific DNA recombinase
VTVDESLDTQKEQCQRYCEFAGLFEDSDEEVVFLEDPHVSGDMDLAKRPAGRRLITRADRGDKIVAQRLDRLFRNTADGLNCVDKWMDLGVSLHLACEGGCTIDTSTAVGYLFFTTRLAQCKFERDLVVERTSAAMKQHMKNGRRMGGSLPYGMVVDPDDPSRMVEDPREQQGIEIITRHLALSDGYKVIGIKRDLIAGGVPPRGQRWHAETIRRIVAGIQERESE